MMTQNSEPLDRLLQEIAHEHPSGLRHADFVKEVLRSGYNQKPRSTSMSVVVHQALMRLVNVGVLVRSEDEDRGVREYHLACAVA